jgi:hypothetical protein
MKTFRQELRNWLKEKKNNEINLDILLLIEEIINKTNDLEINEENDLNRAYLNGHRDGENKKNPKGNYYRETYKINSLFRKLINKK